MDTTTVEAPGTVALEPPSTVLNPETVKTTSGGGKTDVSDKGNSIQDVLDAELTRLKDEDAKAEAEAKEKGQKATDEARAKAEEAKDADKGKEPEKAEKPEAKAEKVRAEDGKFAKKQEDQPEKAEKGAPEKAAAERSAPEDNRQSEGRKYAEPPARFLPEARTKWANVPNEVKAEFHRVSQEMETEIAQSKEARERYEPIRQFDEIARSNGRDLKDSLAKVTQIEQQLARNPIAGLDAILREIGPRKQDGSPVSLMDVVQHIAQNPHAYHQATTAMPTQQPAQQQANPEIEALKAEIQSMRAEQTVVPLIREFSQSHSDFDALSPQIEQILSSGVIEKIYGNGLSPEQKLAEAYRMAGGVPSSRSDPAPVSDHSVAEKPVPSNDAGTKSIRGAPDDGADTSVEEPETDLREMLRKQYRKITA